MLSPSKKAKTTAAAEKNTSSANAAAAGAECLTRSDTPRPERAAGGLVAIHWNVAGLNALLKSDERKALLHELVAAEEPDVIAFSEHKVSTAKLAAGEKDLAALLPGYEAHWAVCTAKNGYSGVVALVKKGLAPVGAPQIDTVGDLDEGRTVTLEFEHVHLVLAYVPNSGMKLERLDYRLNTWEPAMRSHLAGLAAAGKPVALLGDLNVGHLDADIWNCSAKHIPKSPGLTPKERAAFGEMLADGYVDAFRTLHPEATGCFSYWSTRSGNQLLNRGLRLDYAVLSNSLVGGAGGGAKLQLHDCAMLMKYAPNGDHAPTLLALKPVVG